MVRLQYRITLFLLRAYQLWMNIPHFFSFFFFARNCQWLSIDKRLPLFHTNSRLYILYLKLTWFVSVSSIKQPNDNERNAPIGYAYNQRTGNHTYLVPSKVMRTMVTNSRQNARPLCLWYDNKKAMVPCLVTWAPPATSKKGIESGT